MGEAEVTSISSPCLRGLCPRPFTVSSRETDVRLLGVGDDFMHREEVRLQSKQPFICPPGARSGGAQAGLQTQMGV